MTEHLTFIRSFAFEESGFAYNFCSTLPDVYFAVDIDSSSSFKPVMNVWAYVDKETADKVNGLFANFLYSRDDSATLTYQPGFDCYSTVNGSYEEVYPQTQEIYFPKVAPITLAHLAHLYSRKSGIQISSMQNKLILPISSTTTSSDMLTSLTTLLSTIHLAIKEGKTYRLIQSNNQNDIANNDYTFYFSGLLYQFA